MHILTYLIQNFYPYMHTHTLFSHFTHGSACKKFFPHFQLYRITQKKNYRVSKDSNFFQFLCSRHQVQHYTGGLAKDTTVELRTFKSLPVPPGQDSRTWHMQAERLTREFSQVGCWQACVKREGRMMQIVGSF